MNVAFLERLLEIFDEGALAVLVVHIHEHCRADNYLQQIPTSTGRTLRKSTQCAIVIFVTVVPLIKRRFAAAAMRCAHLHGATGHSYLACNEMAALLRSLRLLEPTVAVDLLVVL